MLNNRIYKAQVEMLLSVRSLNLTREDANSILGSVYGLDTRGFLSPEFQPENLAFGGRQFSHIAADIMALNLTAPIAKYPTLKGLEKELIPLLIGAPDFWTFMRDKDDRLSEANTNRDSYISMYGHLPVDEFKADTEILLITNRSRSELNLMLGNEFKGLITSNLESLLPKGPRKVYVDSRYLESNWEEAYKLDIFDGAVLSMLRYLSSSNDNQRLTLINHSDDRCISKLCGYN
jgi:hypothetical protein